MVIEEAEKPFPDLTMETTLVIEDGDTVVGEWIYRAPTQRPAMRLSFPASASLRSETARLPFGVTTPTMPL
jgi:hypothetical protein